MTLKISVGIIRAAAGSINSNESRTQATSSPADASDRCPSSRQRVGKLLDVKQAADILDSNEISHASLTCLLYNSNPADANKITVFFQSRFFYKWERTCCKQSKEWTLLQKGENLSV